MKMFENCSTMKEIKNVLKQLKVTDENRELIKLAVVTRVAELNGTFDDVMECANELEL